MQPEHIKIIDATFYYCLSQYTCGGVDVCATFTNTMGLLNSIESCLAAQNLVGVLGYPPTSDMGNPSNLMAQTLGLTCPNFPLNTWNHAVFEKQDFTGTYSYINATYSGYLNFNATIQSKNYTITLIKNLDCDQTGTYDITVKANASCPETVDDIIGEIVYYASIFECGKRCFMPTCPFLLIVC
jgi:hypothetical protein